MVRSQLPMEGYRVLDVSDIKGQHCGRLLADLGAEVLKIELPTGDPVRELAPFFRNTEISLMWLILNANKRGITLNLKTIQGRDIFRRLASKSDFIVESFPPGYLNELGLGYAELERINPRIVLTSITPFGQTGPYARYKSCDLVTTAMGGLLYRMGPSDHSPVRISESQAYMVAGAQAAAITMIAHNYRQRTGQGQHIDVSMHECQAITLERQVGLCQHDRSAIIKRTGQKVHRGQTLHRELWKCRDGYVAFRILLGPYFRGTKPLIQHMDQEGLAGELADTNHLARLGLETLDQKTVDSWEEKFARFFANHTKAELLQLLVTEDAHLFPLNTLEEILIDDHLRERGYWVRVQHPELNTELTYPGPPFVTTDYSPTIRARAPLLGEHNEEIYCGELGFSAEELVALRNNHTI